MNDFVMKKRLTRNLTLTCNVIKNVLKKLCRPIWNKLLMSAWVQWVIRVPGGIYVFIVWVRVHFQALKIHLILLLHDTTGSLAYGIGSIYWSGNHILYVHLNRTYLSARTGGLAVWACRLSFGFSFNVGFFCLAGSSHVPNDLCWMSLLVSLSLWYVISQV